MTKRNGSNNNSGARAMSMRREPKSFAGTTSAVPTTAGVMVHVTAIDQGDGLSDRSGDKIFVEKIEFGVNVIASATNNLRYILFIDKHNTGSAPTTADLFTANGVGALFNSQYVTQQKRFKILMDKTFSFSSAGKLSAVYLNRGISVKNPTFFTGAGSSNFSAGSIWMLYITSTATSCVNDIRTKVVYSDY